MVFTSIYGIVDGFFIANFDSADAFAGVNLIMPIIYLVGGLGFMIGSGGSALTSKLLGEKKKEDANKVFSMMLIFGFILGSIVSIITFFFIDKITYAMASISKDTTQEMIDKAIFYGRILILGQPLFIIQNLFQNFFVVDEKPNMGFLFTLFAGGANMIFDALFIAAFKWGVAGAAIGTILGFVIGSIGPIIYFKYNKNNLLQIVKTKLQFKIILKCCTNGLSDFIFNISNSIIGIVTNIQLLKYIGQNGVSAHGIIMYVSFIFMAIFIGLIIGMQPIIGYNYGAQNHKELKNVVKKLFILYGSIGLAMMFVSIILAKPLSMIFSKDPELIKLSTKAMILYSLSYIFAGECIFITGMFTGLNNGLISGIISFFRTLLFEIVFIIVFPLIFGSDGIWWSVFASELASFIMSIIFLLANKKKYKY